jgi:hypothetical protein
MTSRYWVIGFRSFRTNVMASFSRVGMSKISTLEDDYPVMQRCNPEERNRRRLCCVNIQIGDDRWRRQWSNWAVCEMLSNSQAERENLKYEWLIGKLILKVVLEKYVVKCPKWYMVQTVGVLTGYCKDCNVPWGAIKLLALIKCGAWGSVVVKALRY